MSTVSMAAARARLAAYAHRRIPAEGLMKKAAVAAVLRHDSAQGLGVLMIRRAEHPKDPWSGHMAFPGGRVDAGDADPLSAAIRETHEELGVDLRGQATHAGELSHLVAMAHGKPLPMIVVPFVFTMEHAPAFSLLATEVQEALWVPMRFLMDETNRTTIEVPIAGLPVKLPAYRYEGRVIWGLTLRMLDELMGVIR
jgi:8-oxo-dGTP pyrophosphatase MutT (NUDIX family)